MADQENFRLCKEVTIRIVRRDLFFNKPARTSRDVLTKHEAHYFLLLSADRRLYGIGECSPIWGLSPENRESFSTVCKTLEKNKFSWEEFLSILDTNPSLRFAIETACLDYLSGGKRTIVPDYQTKEIPINGLVWMNDAEEMFREASEKIALGFTTIKLKVGAINFEQELNLLKKLRREFSNQIQIRLDANGAFSLKDALMKLELLSKFNIQSIEQPVKAGQGEEFAEIIKESPISIALDEELIGIMNRETKSALLDQLKPHYIILKPTLHQGLSGCEEWIQLAEQKGIGWWMTSALESSIGLNAIAQFVAAKNAKLPQGLGTGGLYQNNIPSPLKINEGKLYWSKNQTWDVSEILSLI